MNLRQAPTLLHHFLAAHWRWRTLDQPKLATFQDHRARHIVAIAHRDSPFYREHWREQNIRDWRTLPTIDKVTMMAHFATFNRYGIPHAAALNAAQAAEDPDAAPQPLYSPDRTPITAGLSSGTSGERGLFLITEREIAMWAGVILARALHRIPWRGCRVAFFLRAFSRLYAGVNSPLLQLRYFALTQPQAEVITALNGYQPQIVIGPPSLLATLAEAQQQGILHINPNRFIAVAEVLEAQDKTQLQQIFAVPIHQIYQCTEGLLAVSCAHGRLHIQEDLVALQLEAVALQHGDKATDDPNYYTPIVTDLWRTTQPIIRYRLGDLLRLDGQPCPCGSPFRVIEAIEGRMADLLYFTAHTRGAAPSTRTPLFPATIRQLILDSSPAIRDYQVVQSHDDQFQIDLVVEPSAEFATVAQRVASRVHTAIIARGGRPPQITTSPGLPNRAATAKRRRVQRRQG